MSAIQPNQRRQGPGSHNQMEVREREFQFMNKLFNRAALCARQGLNRDRTRENRLQLMHANMFCLPEHLMWAFADRQEKDMYMRGTILVNIKQCTVQAAVSRNSKDPAILGLGECINFCSKLVTLTKYVHQIDFQIFSYPNRGQFWECNTMRKTQVVKFRRTFNCCKVLRFVLFFSIHSH